MPSPYEEAIIRGDMFQMLFKQACGDIARLAMEKDQLRQQLKQQAAKVTP